MSDVKSILMKVASGLEDNLDAIAFSLRKRLGFQEPLQIVTYRSYGTPNRLYIKGRVLEDKAIEKPTAKDSLWNNIVRMYQRFESDEVPGARLKIIFEGQVHYATTDPEGYFVFNLTTETPLLHEDMWHKIEIELVESPIPFAKGLKATTQILVPSADAEYGIISDIDDTIIKTTATNLLAMSRNTFFNNAYTRLPFAGVSEFYKALQLGRNGKRNNPFFYVSSSPWNLYDLLIDFLDINKIPPGPLLLRDFGLTKSPMGGHIDHKFKEIENILVTYPTLNFVLIGDSGQEDPKIYQEVIKKYPDRILAVYIRDVQLADREKIAINISEELRAQKVEMLVVDNTVEAAEHAANIKLIFKEAIPEIITDKKQDKGELAGKQEI